MQTLRLFPTHQIISWRLKPTLAPRRNHRAQPAATQWQTQEMARVLPSSGQMPVSVTISRTHSAMALRAISCCASIAVMVDRSVQRRVRPNNSSKPNPHRHFAQMFGWWPPPLANSTGRSSVCLTASQTWGKPFLMGSMRHRRCVEFISRKRLVEDLGAKLGSLQQLIQADAASRAGPTQSPGTTPTHVATGGV